MSRLIAQLAVVLAAVGASGCASRAELPAAETPYLRAKIAAPTAAPASPHVPLDVHVAPRSPRSDPLDGLLDMSDARLAAYAARLRSEPDVGLAEPLDAEKVRVAVWVRNPSVAAARAEAEAALRAYEQASWIDDLETRFRSVGAAMTNVRETMSGAPLAYPGSAALRGEMLDRAQDMAQARLRMAWLESATETLRAFHDAAHHIEELGIRRDQLGVLDRLVDAARARVESGRAPQAELSEAVAERAMVASDVAHAETSLVSARRRLNAFLDREPDAPLDIDDRPVVPTRDPDAAALTALARAHAPSIAMARAEAAMLAAAERMALRMTHPGAAPRTASMPEAPMPTAPDATATPPAWAAEISARREAAERAADESVRRAERDVAAAIYDASAMARMYRVASEATEPATRQALDERLRLFEGGRGEMTTILAAFRRHLEAMHDVAQARHDHAVAIAMLTMAVGTRLPEDVR